MRITEPLPNDGAAFKCGRTTTVPPDYCCGKPATHLLTMEVWRELNMPIKLFKWRAVCADHATEAAIEMGE